MYFNIVYVEEKLLTTILGNRRDYIGTKHLEGWINIWLKQACKLDHTVKTIFSIKLHKVSYVARNRSKIFNYCCFSRVLIKDRSRIAPMEPKGQNATTNDFQSKSMAGNISQAE